MYFNIRCLKNFTFYLSLTYDTIRPFLKSIQARSVVVVADGYPLDFLPFQVLLQLLKERKEIALLWMFEKLHTIFFFPYEEVVMHSLALRENICNRLSLFD